MRFSWWRDALQQRLGTLTAAALILWTTLTAVAASVATAQVNANMLAEREARARTIAAHLEAALQAPLRQLDLVAAASVRPADATSLAGEVRRVQFAESVMRVDRFGAILWSRSVADGGETAPPMERFPDLAAARWYVEGTELLQTAGGGRTFLVLPARESDPAGGAVAASIDPRRTALGTLLAAYRGEPYRVDLIDTAGHEIASSRPGPPGRLPGAEADLLAAWAPIADSRWRVRLAQPRAEALAPVLTLRRILVGSSLVLLPFAVLVAVGAARSIRSPVLAMTATAERLARGEFAAPIEPAGRDEIGRLAAALETLRRGLEGDDRRARLLKRVITAQEEERRRIARELHDQTSQQLTALAIQLDSLAGAQPSTAPALTRARDIVRTAIDDLHRVIHDLRPSMLDDLGLLPAIGSCAQSRLASRGIQVHCEFPDRLPHMSHDATTALYRVAQEALTNVARHSGADTVLIGCTASADQVVIEIEDDGSGFDPAAMAHPRESGEGLGLLGMRERLALLGGSLTIESEPGRGTRVVAMLPLRPEPAGAGA